MSGRRVVLLARAGGARDRIEAALNDAEAELAGTFDPGTATLDEVRAALPDAVLVLLDPSLEHDLERFAPLLADAALDVVYEDADVAGRREGWEAARWARHLRAKLQGHDDVLPPASAGSLVDGPANWQRPLPDMEQLQRDVAAMPELAQHVAVAPPAGAVVAVAGTGGPDALRQLLSGLPAGFPRPILLWQRIDGGQYDRLVRQLGRASALPVLLAKAGDAAQPGRAYVVPDGVGVQAGCAGLHFVAGVGAPVALAALQQSDSALLLLSGADPALVDAAMAMRWAGGLALGQSRENCFDPAASDALVARGGEALGLAGLSRQLLDRWPA